MFIQAFLNQFILKTCLPNLVRLIHHPDRPNLHLQIGFH